MKGDFPIPINYLYDKKGSELYNQIITHPNYYLYDVEKKLISENTHIINNFEPNSIILEIACGYAEKIIPLIKKGQESPHMCRFLANDISYTFIKDTTNLYQKHNLELDVLCENIFMNANVIREKYPDQNIILVWLGSSLGNFSEDTGIDILRKLILEIKPSSILLGCDLWNDKKEDILKNAYDNEITRDFILNGYHNYNKDLNLNNPLSVNYKVNINSQKKRVEMGIVNENKFYPLEYSHKLDFNYLHRLEKELGLFQVEIIQCPKYHYGLLLYDTQYSIKPVKFYNTSLKFPDLYIDASYPICQDSHNPVNCLSNINGNDILTKWTSPILNRKVLNNIINLWYKFPQSIITKFARSKVKHNSFLFKNTTCGISNILNNILKNNDNLIVRITPDYKICASNLDFKQEQFLDIKDTLSPQQLSQILSDKKDKIKLVMINHPSAPLGIFKTEIYNTLFDFCEENNTTLFIDELLIPTLSLEYKPDWFREQFSFPVILLGGLSKIGMHYLSPSFMILLNSKVPVSNFHHLKLGNIDLHLVDQFLNNLELPLDLSNNNNYLTYLLRLNYIPYEIHDSICFWLNLSKWIKDKVSSDIFYHRLYRDEKILVTPGYVLGHKHGYFRVRYNFSNCKIYKIVEGIKNTLAKTNTEYLLDYHQHIYSDNSNISNTIFNLLDEKYINYKPIGERHPFIFYMGHIPAFSRNIINQIYNINLEETPFNNMFLRGIDPNLRTGEVHDNSIDNIKKKVGHINYPTTDEISLFKRETEQQIANIIRNNLESGLTISPKTNIIYEHEWMHQETIMYLFQKLNLNFFNKTELENLISKLPKLKLNLSEINVDWIKLPSSIIQRGVNKEEDKYYQDNEIGISKINMPDLMMTKYPITNNQFKIFIDNGGYQTEEFWEKEHWKWIQSKNIILPESWERKDNNTLIRFPLRIVKLNEVLDHPCNVSLAEAFAFTKWYSKNNNLDGSVRIPSEEEWLQAIEKRGDNIPELYLREPSNTNQLGKVMETRQIISNKYLENSCGISHLVGNAWEMTSSKFKPFPGFVREQYYPEYSTDFFDNYHYVLKGASWATPKHLVRPSFRNFYQDLYRYNITQFRMVMDVVYNCI